jgi:hypothetical protein
MVVSFLPPQGANPEGGRGSSANNIAARRQLRPTGVCLAEAALARRCDEEDD